MCEHIARLASRYETCWDNYFFSTLSSTIWVELFIYIVVASRHLGRYGQRPHFRYWVLLSIAMLKLEIIWGVFSRFGDGVSWSVNSADTKDAVDTSGFRFSHH